jgi:uncharacterized repeat protein (TIGR01451 family)
VARLRVEGLESRCLLSVTINEFPIPTARSGPTDIVTDGDNGALWFTEGSGNKIGEIGPTTHAIDEFPLPPGKTFPHGITAGRDGNLWFTDRGDVGQIDPTTHAIAEFPTPSGSVPEEITASPDGNIWFTEDTGAIGEINPTTHAIAEFAIPPVPGQHFSDSFGITAGPDGNLWFTEGNGEMLGEINPTTHAIVVFPTPGLGSSTWGITTGPDGNLWFTEPGPPVDKIGQINPTTHAIAEFPTPTKESVPVGITAGPDGNLWFTDATGNKIGQINPMTHVIAEFPIPTPDSEPLAITAGPDGNLWFTEESGNKIGEVVLTPQAPAPDLALSGSASHSVTLGNNVTYTLSLTNNGTAGATGVTLTDTLPSSVTFVSATGGVRPINGVLTFGLGNLAAGASRTVTLVVSPTAAGTLSDTAAASMDQTDPTPADNSVTLRTTSSITVSGTIKGTFTSGTLPGSPITFNGQGTVSPVGRVTFKGSLKITILNPKATLTISTSKGKLYLTATEHSLGGPVSITIKGGTGIYHAASGTGTGSLKLVNAPGKGPVRGTFTFKFHGTLTT